MVHVARFCTLNNNCQTHAGRFTLVYIYTRRKTFPRRERKAAVEFYAFDLLLFGLFYCVDRVDENFNYRNLGR